MFMVNRFVTAFALTFTMLAGGGYAAEKLSKPQSKCPVTGLKIQKKQYVDIEGSRIYLCCPACKAVVKKDPKAAILKIAKSGEMVESRQKLCPVMGNPVNPKLFVEHQGRRLYVCCPPCAAKVKASPDAFAEKISAAVDGKAGAPESKPRAPQTICPIMGNKINKNLSTKVKGYRIYVCCPPCLNKVKAEPEAALKKIRERGESPERAK